MARAQTAATALGAAIWLVAGCDSACGSDHANNDAATNDAATDSPALDSSPCTASFPLVNCSSCWSQLSAGTFTMGSPTTEFGRGAADEDQVTVTLTHAFAIAKYETTQATWTAACHANPSHVDSRDGTGDGLGDNFPVGTLTWWETLSFANEMSTAAGFTPCYVLGGCSGVVGVGLVCKTVSLSAPTVYECSGYRLPTEAEWEYAARAGTTTAFYSGGITNYAIDECHPDDAASAIAWYCQNSGMVTHAVGGLMPNAFGLFDMSGNAAEWVNDVFVGSGYGAGPNTDPVVLGTGAELQRVLRGGIAYYYASGARSAARLPAAPSVQALGAYGFRLVRTVGPNTDP